jgi:hypothetical protein
MIPKAFLDVARHLLILAATAYATVTVWQWNWIAGIVFCIPLYVVMLNVFGFLTLPLYLLTSEVRRAREMERALFQRAR